MPLPSPTLSVGNTWVEISIDLPVGSTKVTFVGHKGGTDSSVSGDIALDDISLARLGVATTSTVTPTTTTIVVTSKMC